MTLETAEPRWSPAIVVVDPVRRRSIIGLAVMFALALLALLPSASRAAVCDPPVANKIACENSKPGTPSSEWRIEGAGDKSIQGFATAMSVNVGARIDFKIKSATPDYTIDIFRLGYYDGEGARLIASNVAHPGSSTQPACQEDSSSGLIDCGNWAVSGGWTVPSSAVSGVYIAKLMRTDTEGASHITFVVRDDASTSDIVLQTSDATWQAYNTYGGNSTYKCTTSCPSGEPLAYKAAYKVSYNRPFNSAEDDLGGRSFLWWSEYPMIRFLEASGYDVSYASQIDVEARGSLLRNHRMFISSGHDEYWSQTQRDNVEAARDAGVNLAFFSGNEIFWKTRYEPSIAGAPTSNRTLVTYKDTHFTEQVDPVAWTGTWRDPRFTTPPNRPIPENALTGQQFSVNAGTADIMVPAAYKNLRMWRNTAVANLTSGSVRLAPGTLGFEWDEDADNGFRPAGQFRLSSTTVSGVEKFTDYGSTVAIGTATHNLTSYRAPSGALVFGAGTVQWAWGLDDANRFQNPPDRTMRQATVNLFADMGAQPYALLPGLVAATASTDTTAPSSTISSPTGGAVSDGSIVTVSGTAADTGGGNVAGVEVSTDDGRSWHPATGTSNWTYRWTVHGSPRTTVRSRAVDDTGNLESPQPGVALDVNCPCSIWGNITPPTPDSGDGNAVEVGVKFKTETFGTISGIRFYKSAANTGTHTGSLWTADGQRLAQATFTAETASGWQRVTFANPVPITAGTTYVASYYAPRGHYAASAEFMHPPPAPSTDAVGGIDSPPLHALADTQATRNGVYAYSFTSTFPTATFKATNYWVDVMFAPAPAPGAVTNVTATADFGAARVSWSAPSTGGAVTAYKITPYIGATAQTPVTVTGSPPVTTRMVSGLTPGETYTFRVEASNPNGVGPQSAASNAVVPAALTTPGAPTAVAAEAPSESSLKVSWTPPASDGGVPITSYAVTRYAGTTAQATTTVNAPTTDLLVTGLETGAQYTFRVVASNELGAGPPSAASPAVTPFSTVFALARPTMPDSGDGNAVELGVKFRADVAGTVHGIRFFKSAANVGTHVGSLWTAGGQRLAQATFTNESGSGWQTVTFANPVSVDANTTYVASYHAPNGRYAFSSGAFASAAIDNGVLHAPSSPAVVGNGVFMYGATSTFPAQSHNASNYWVDVTFVTLPAPGQVTDVSATPDQASARVTWSAPASGGAASSYVITPYIGASPQATTTVSGTPPGRSATVRNLTAGTAYTFRVRAVNANATGPPSAESNTVTPTAPTVASAPTGVSAQPATRSARVSWSPPGNDGGRDITRYVVTPFVGSVAQPSTDAGATATSVTVDGLRNGTSYTFRVAAVNQEGTGPASGASSSITPMGTLLDLTTPTIADAGDTNGVELGVRFRTAVEGAIHGIRFYKSTANTGTHVGSLWTAGGQRLAQATFTSESASGWQTVTFATPVSIEANTTYVASYHAPNGHYALTSNALASSAIVNGDLTAPASSTSGGNGVYAYGPSGSFPSRSFNASNYWVDVRFVELSLPGEVTGVNATPDYGAARVTWSPPSDGGPVRGYTITPYIGADAQTPVTVTGSPPVTAKTISGLEPGVAYTFRVRSTNPNGSGPTSVASAPVVPLAVTPPSAPTGVSANVGTSTATVQWTAPDNDGGRPVTGYTITPFVGGTAQPATTAGASATSASVPGLASGTTYTFRVSATNSVGTGPQSGASAPGTTPFATILGQSTPATIDAGDPNAVELGVKFRSDVAGAIHGIRFYRAAANTGSHTVNLWTLGGQRLAQATAGPAGTTGWQTVTFASPVPITAGTVYVASYFAPNGHYSATSGAFASGVDSGPLHALANTTSANGLFFYTGTSAFPTNSWNATSYSVDVLFAGPSS